METICHTAGAAVPPSQTCSNQTTRHRNSKPSAPRWPLNPTCSAELGVLCSYGFNWGAAEMLHQFKLPSLSPILVSLQALASTTGQTSGGCGLCRERPKQGQPEHIHVHPESARLQQSLASQAPSNAKPGSALQAALLSYSSWALRAGKANREVMQ